MLMFAQESSMRGKFYHNFVFFMLYLTSGWWELKYDRPIYEGLPTLWYLNLIFSPRKCIKAKNLPKITESGLYFALNGPEKHF